MIRILLASLCALFLSGCATEAHYRSLDNQSKAITELARVKMELISALQSKPLVDFSWTDENGVDHHMTVNQPVTLAYYDQAIPQFPHIPAPWEGWLSAWDRTAGMVTSALPWVGAAILGTSSGSGRTSTSYVFGDNGTMQQTWGAGSGINMTRDITTITGVTE